MRTPKSPRRLLACDVRRQPQLPAVSVLRAAATVAIPALLSAHPAVAEARLATPTEVEADHIVHLAARLRDAIDNYRQVLREADLF
jgi:hypothetical protein